MPAPEDLQAFVRSWIDTATSDVEAARVLLDNEQIDPLVAAYHVQQAAEKALKAILFAVEAGPPRTHDLALLRRLVVEAVPAMDNLLPPEASVAPLSDFAGPGRYPDSGFGLRWEHGEVKGALTVARRVVDLARAFASQSGG